MPRVPEFGGNRSSECNSSLLATTSTSSGPSRPRRQAQPVPEELAADCLECFCGARGGVRVKARDWGYHDPEVRRFGDPPGLCGEGGQQDQRPNDDPQDTAAHESSSTGELVHGRLRGKGFHAVLVQLQI